MRSRSRARLLLPALLALLAGCDVGSITMERRSPPASGDDAAVPPAGDGGMPGIDPEAGRTPFGENVLPALEESCGGCHGADSTAPPFMAPAPDVYSTVMAWPALVEPGSPSSSRLLTKGEHAGPAFSTEQAAVVREWIDLEGTIVEGGSGGADGGAPMEYRTDPIAPRLGANDIDLGPLGMPGSTLEFTASRVESGLYLNDMEVTAGPTGVHLVHPVVVTIIGSSYEADPVDRLSGVEVRAAAFTTEQIGGGTFSVVDFPESGQLTFYFDAAGPLTGGASGSDGGMPATDGGTTMPTGCTNVEGFTRDARPQLAVNCVSCHGGTNPTATGALDMTDINDLAPDAQQRACNQILTRVDRADPRSSPIFLQPAPGSMHDFSFGSTAELDEFRSDILLWLATEAL